MCIRDRRLSDHGIRRSRRRPGIAGWSRYSHRCDSEKVEGKIGFDPGACLKKHFRNLQASLCGIFFFRHALKVLQVLTKFCIFRSADWQFWQKNAYWKKHKITVRASKFNRIKQVAKRIAKIRLTPFPAQGRIRAFGVRKGQSVFRNEARESQFRFTRKKEGE